MAAGKQLLNLGRDPVEIGEPGRVVRAIELNHARAGNVIGEIPARLHRNGGVISGMENSVGTVIVGRIGLTSVRNPASSVARAIPELAHMRSNIPSWRIDRADEMTYLSASPLPHADRTARPNSWERAIHSADGA
jgi:hypothetical protein